MLFGTLDAGDFWLLLLIAHQVTMEHNSWTHFGLGSIFEWFQGTLIRQLKPAGCEKFNVSNSGAVITPATKCATTVMPNFDTIP